MKTFTYHVILDRENICNYTKEQQILVREVLRGQRIVLFGRRNTGKTSLIQSVIIPEFRKKHPNGLVVSVDFMGVQNLSDIDSRIKRGFEDGFRKAFPKKATLQKMLGLIKRLRPLVSVDPATGEINMSVDLHEPGRSVTHREILREVGEIHKKAKALLVFDEFQDISFVRSASAQVRGALQELPSDLPVVVLGSKKHLLTTMFADPKSPFAGWGFPLEMPKIPADEFEVYMNERFKQFGLKISKPGVDLLLRLAQGIPECVNIVCYVLSSQFENQGEITTVMIQKALENTLIRFRSNHLELLSHFSGAEQEVLIRLAIHQPVSKPFGHEFLRKIRISPAGVRKILKRFEDTAMIYRDESGYVLADPLFARFLAQLG